VFVQRPEYFPAIKKYEYEIFVIDFPGSREPFENFEILVRKILCESIRKDFYSQFKNVNLVLVSADERAIQDLIARSEGKILLQSIFKFRQG